jgi:hypothetical protein
MTQDTTIVRRAALGHGWETTSQEHPASQSVKIRSGAHITCGRMIGEASQPRAFVWIDEAANDPKREVVICPATDGRWLWEDGNATTLEAAFPDNKAVQHQARKFDYWLNFLRQHWDPSTPQRFFWGRFHDEGLGLARQLQARLVEEAVVRYWRPAQDPRSSSDREIEL